MKKKIREFEIVIVATGLFSKPIIPQFYNQQLFKGQIIHSSQYVNTDQIIGKRVLVVGGGKSALEIATECVGACKKKLI